LANARSNYLCWQIADVKRLAFRDHLLLSG
jgi:hypothetical protein